MRSILSRAWVASRRPAPHCHATLWTRSPCPSQVKTSAATVRSHRVRDVPLLVARRPWAAGWNPTVSTCELKGQCHEIVDFRFFHESVSPKPQRRYPITAVLNFVEYREYRGPPGGTPPFQPVQRKRITKYQCCGSGSGINIQDPQHCKIRQIFRY